MIDRVFPSTDKASGLNVKAYFLNTLGNNLLTAVTNFNAKGIPVDLRVPVKATEKTWIIWRVTNASGGVAFASIGYSMRLVPNSRLASY